MDNHDHFNLKTPALLDQLLQNNAINSPDAHEYFAFLLINEFDSITNTPFKQNHMETRWGLLNQLIDDNQVSEENCQRLLLIKVKYLIELKQFESALVHLNQLDNPDYRLTCNTHQYFQLLLLRSRINIIRKEFDLAFACLQNNCSFYFSTEEFLSLPKHQEILKEWYRQSAIAAHFCSLDFSYPLFQVLINNSESSFSLDESNINFFVTFANECFRQKKYSEASSLFLKLMGFIDEKPYLVDEDLKIEIMCLNIISQKLTSPLQLISVMDHDKFEKILSACSNLLSEKNQKLKNNVIDLIKKENQLYRKMYLPKMSYEKKVGQIPLAGDLSIAGPNMSRAGQSSVTSYDMNITNSTDAGTVKHETVEAFNYF